MVVHRNARNESKVKTDASRERFVDAAAAVRDDVADMGSAAKSMAQDQVRHLADEVAGLRDTVEQKVIEQPLKALLIAGGVGIVLGFMLRR